MDPKVSLTDLSTFLSAHSAPLSLLPDCPALSVTDKLIIFHPTSIHCNLEWNLECNIQTKRQQCYLKWNLQCNFQCNFLCNFQCNLVLQCNLQCNLHSSAASSATSCASSAAQTQCSHCRKPLRESDESLVPLPPNLFDPNLTRFCIFQTVQVLIYEEPLFPNTSRLSDKEAESNNLSCKTRIRSTYKKSPHWDMAEVAKYQKFKMEETFTLP